MLDLRIALCAHIGFVRKVMSVIILSSDCMPQRARTGWDWWRATYARTVVCDHLKSKERHDRVTAARSPPSGAACRFVSRTKERAWKEKLTDWPRREVRALHIGEVTAFAPACTAAREGLTPLILPILWQSCPAVVRWAWDVILFFWTALWF